MKMFLVFNQSDDGIQFGGLYRNKDAAIRRANYVARFASDSDFWQVGEIGRQPIKGAIERIKIVHIPQTLSSEELEYGN